MADSLNLFPSRIPIGRTDATGAVYASAEFQRALAALMSRVGGAEGPATDDVELEAALASTVPLLADDGHLALLSQPAPLAALLLAAVAEIQGQVAMLTSQAAGLGELAKQLASAELDALPVVRPTDWEHPGKIGARTPNSGAFTTLSVNGVALGSAAFKNVTDFAARSNTALAPAAIDAATTQTLANSLRAVLLSVGIGA